MKPARSKAGKARQTRTRESWRAFVQLVKVVGLVALGYLICLYDMYQKNNP